MVKLEEVPDEELNAPQPYSKEEEDDWDTDDGQLTPTPPFHPLSSPYLLI